MRADVKVLVILPLDNGTGEVNSSSPQMGVATMKVWRTASEAVDNAFDKAIFHNGEYFATGDLEDLPVSTTPWREVSVKEALS